MLDPEQIEDLADKIYELFKKNGIWADTDIWFNGMMLSNKDHNGTYHYDGSAFLHQDKNPSDCFGCATDHVLSMTFEGSVYHMFNYGSFPDVMKKFTELLERHGLYYEMGDAWNLTCYYS